MSGQRDMKAAPAGGQKLPACLADFIERLYCCAGQDLKIFVVLYIIVEDMHWVVWGANGAMGWLWLEAELAAAFMAVLLPLCEQLSSCPVVRHIQFITPWLNCRLLLRKLLLCRWRSWTESGCIQQLAPACGSVMVVTSTLPATGTTGVTTCACCTPLLCTSHVWVGGSLIACPIDTVILCMLLFVDIIR